MFPRDPGDTRLGAAQGETERLPLAETPCPSCTSILDALDGAARPLDNDVNLAVVAKNDPERIGTFAASAAGGACACCPRGTTPSTAPGRDTRSTIT